MSDASQSSNPPPGWYPDPGSAPGYRWWDGYRWTETVTDDVTTALESAAGGDTYQSPDVSAVKNQLGRVGPWLSEAFRVAISRSGHFLPMILLFVLSVSIPTSFAIWYALRDTVITFDANTGVPDIDYGGSVAWLWAVVVATPLTILLSFVGKAAIIRQTWATQIEMPEPWSASVMEVLRRSKRVISVSLARTVLYWGASVLFLFGLQASPVFILLLPVLVLGLLTVWVRFSFAGTVAAIGGPQDKSFSSSWRLSSGMFFSLTGRLVLLAFVAVNLILAAGIIGTPLTAIAGGGGRVTESSDEALRLNDFLGSNPSIFALGSVFNAIGLGANYVLSAVGTTLLYRNLGGPVAENFSPTEAE